MPYQDVIAVNTISVDMMKYADQERVRSCELVFIEKERLGPGVWCLAGENVDGLIYETDDEEADSLLDALAQAIAYLQEYNRPGEIAPDDLLTPAEAAERTGEAESTWRNRCARGDAPGAFKKGKQWLIPAEQVP